MSRWLRISGMGLAVASVVGCGTTTSSPSSVAPVSSSPLYGQVLFEHVCFYCHGRQGQGNAHDSGAPPLWGPNSPLVTGGTLNGALNTMNGLAAYIEANMPLKTVNGVKPGSLTHAQALSLARFIRGHH